MISKFSYTNEHINNIKVKYPKLDNQLIERTIFALGLLEALVKVNLPFVFKGGTSLMLLLKYPYRLSTDIDIVVSPTCDVDKYLDEVSKIYPFIRSEEQIRKGKNNIVKKHYKFFYESPSKHKEIPILLDVLYEENSYAKIIKREITSEFLVNEKTNLLVDVPSIESILGDKLTAFAPNTTGIKYSYINKNGQIIEKNLEVIKQFLDCAQLIKETTDYEEVFKTYEKVVAAEINYRGIKVSSNECLMDTFNAALAIFTRGSIYKEQYEQLLSGIRKIQNHIFGFDISGETAYLYASEVMIAVAILIKKKFNVEMKDQELLFGTKFRSINQMRKLNKEAFNKAAYAIRLLELENWFGVENNILSKKCVK